MKVRRVVTGHTPDGKSMIASDTQVDPITVAIAPGEEFHRLWGTDKTPTFPDDGSPLPSLKYLPPVGGVRFGIFTVPPQSVALPETLDLDAPFKELEEKLPGVLADMHMETDNPGMHTTNSMDFEYVISGEVWLELDEGREIHLRAGDTVVQNGTRHAWRNKGSEPCRMVVCLVGAHRS